MTLNLSKPILYLITHGATTETTTPQCPEFLAILQQAAAAINAGVQLIQIREKQLTARILFELTAELVSLARGSGTRVLVNDRADIAACTRLAMTTTVDGGLVAVEDAIVTCIDDR